MCMLVCLVAAVVFMFLDMTIISSVAAVCSRACVTSPKGSNLCCFSGKI